ncbi:hypothetical protein GGTG_13293 [Gaeumannomyces tritici R3-111a-1]|uniref:Uncharacterized protein n=1 Tax=Gaeumannomyces tritici (strain R3-111a-1) TaxID=644352 RepID=J3PIG5_GAET3|nr:hypothetical protein GGTG_13293 [Gaeumannomyces tritici R3-111a-1]EJT69184.1 hypothetical protein GGTG_13293 [Gaeumannomyces tritici R3-111a-1]
MTTEIPPVHPDVRGGASQPDEERVRIDWGWKFGNSDALVAEFAQLVVFTVLNLPTDYNNDAVGLFLELDGSAIASKVRSQLGPLVRQGVAESLHRLSLLRPLVAAIRIRGQPFPRRHLAVKARRNFQPDAFDPNTTSLDNLRWLGSLVGIEGSNQFGSLTMDAMRTALSRSKAFAGRDVDRGALPAEVLARLSVAQLESFQAESYRQSDAPTKHSGSC